MDPRRSALPSTLLILCGIGSWFLSAPPARGQGMGMEQAVREASEEAARRKAAALAQSQGMLAGTCPYTLTNVTIPKATTGTNWVEPVVIMTPCMFNPAGPDLPLVVVWNGYGNSPAKFFMDNSVPGMQLLPDEANARGWLMLAITGIDDKALGCVDPIPAQTNVAAAIDYMIANYPVDQQRIYLLGWSAGAGAAAAYAARHLDPAAPMFAALALNDGSFDLIDAYNKEVISYRTYTDLVFGGPPSTSTFTYRYERAESERTDLFLNVLEPRSQARNLSKTPILHVYPTNDKVAYLPAQNVKFASFLSGKGAPITSTPISTPTKVHEWTLLDPVATFDFFAAHTRDAAPPAMQITADHDGAYYWADVVQRAPNDFSTFVVTTNTATQTLSASGVGNVNTLALAPPVGTIDLGTHFTLSWNTSDDNPTTVRIDGVPAQPSYLLQGDTVFKDWTYDGALDRLELTLAGSGTKSILVRFDELEGVVTAPATVKVNNNVTFNLTGPTPNQAYIVLLGMGEGVLPIGLFDPGDDRNILVGFAPLPVMLVSALDGAGAASLNVFVPNDASLIGKSLRCQFVTFPGGTKIIDAVSNRADVMIKAGP